MGSSGRRIWSGKVSTRWTPPVDLFTKDAEMIAREVLHGHDGDLASSVSAINFYINRAGRNLSERDLARLRHARRIIQESARPRGAAALGSVRRAANNPDRRCRNCNRIMSKSPGADVDGRKVVGFGQMEGWCDRCAAKPRKGPERPSSPGRRAPRQEAALRRMHGERNPSEERVDVLCGCGWGQLAMPLSEVPKNCPLCGLGIGADGSDDGEGYDGGFECEDCEEGQALDPDQTCGSCGRYRGPGTA